MVLLLSSLGDVELTCPQPKRAAVFKRARCCGRPLLLSLHLCAKRAGALGVMPVAQLCTGRQPQTCSDGRYSVSGPLWLYSY